MMHGGGGGGGYNDYRNQYNDRRGGGYDQGRQSQQRWGNDSNSGNTSLYYSSQMHKTISTLV